MRQVPYLFFRQKGGFLFYLCARWCGSSHGRLRQGALNGCPLSLDTAAAAGHGLGRIGRLGSCRSQNDLTVFEKLEGLEDPVKLALKLFVSQRLWV